MSYNFDTATVISDGNYRYFRPSMINLKKQVESEKKQKEQPTTPVETDDSKSQSPKEQTDKQENISKDDKPKGNKN